MYLVIVFDEVTSLNTVVVVVVFPEKSELERQCQAGSIRLEVSGVALATDV